MTREQDAGAPERDDPGSDEGALEPSDEGTSLGRLRELARPPEDPVAEPEGERQQLLNALQAPSEMWRLTALQGLLRLEPPAALADLASSLLRTSSDPFLAAYARLALAAAGRADVDDLARRALGRGGVVDERRWPVRPRL